MKKKTKTHERIFKYLFFTLFITYVALYFSGTTGYYDYSNYKKTVLTNEKIKQFEQDVKEGKEELPLTKEKFESYLMTNTLPMVDLLIRTSGEERISNYLLYQIAYAEFVFCEEAWPDFNKEVLNRCLEEYKGRDRRFGGVKNV